MVGRNRVAKLLNECSRSGLDGILILPGANMRYLIDFNVEVFERPAFLLAGFGLEPVLVIPRLDEDRARDAVGNICEVRSYTDETGPWNWVEQLFSNNEGTVGIEGKMTLSFYKILQSKAPRLRFREIDEILSSMRLCKDSNEVNRHRQASQLLQEVMLRTFSEVRPEISEREAAFIFYRHAHENGAETSYCLIQSGANSANPHLEPTEKRIHNDDIVVFDAVVSYRGYYADITRTFVLGKASETHKKVFDAVLESQNRALDKAASGVAAEEIDRAARKPLEQAGLGRYFIHRTGHGLGLEVHEEPYIREGNKTYLQAGMIFTVEPGVYLPGKFGVRLEDNLVINATNVENTTHLPKTITLPIR